MTHNVRIERVNNVRLYLFYFSLGTLEDKKLPVPYARKVSVFHSRLQANGNWTIFIFVSTFHVSVNTIFEQCRKIKGEIF